PNVVKNVSDDLLRIHFRSPSCHSGGRSVSENRLRNNEHVPGHHLHVFRDIAFVEQIVEPHTYSHFLSAHSSNDGCALTCRKLCKASDGDHHIEDRHAVTKLQRFRFHGLADHSHLLLRFSDESLDDH